MLIKKIIITGNKFSDFANNNGIFTYDEFVLLTTLEHESLSNDCKYNVQLGQGLSDKQIENICQKINDADMSSRFCLVGMMHKIKRASNQLTHKHKTQNCLISEPVKISHGEYQCFLMLDDECAEMSDHLTGQHIQGMVLIESARQMINAVAEKFLISSDISNMKSFVLNGIESNFKQYIFPLEATLCLEILNLKNGFNGDFKAEGTIKIYQNNMEMCSIDVSFSVADKNILSAIERSMAEESINQNRECWSRNMGDSLFVA